GPPTAGPRRRGPRRGSGRPSDATGRGARSEERGATAVGGRGSHWSAPAPPSVAPRSSLLAPRSTSFSALEAQRGDLFGDQAHQEDDDAGGDEQDRRVGDVVLGDRGVDRVGP